MNLLKKDLYNIRYVLLILMCYFCVAQYLFGTVCIFKIVTGTNCPGCGLTRACYYFLTFRFSKSLSYNRCAIFWIISMLIFLIDRYIYKFKNKYLLYIIVGISFIVTLVNYFI